MTKEENIINRYLSHTKQQIAAHKLNLSNRVVFTELATNNYVFISLISSLAKAKKIYCYIKETSFASKIYLKNLFKEIQTYTKRNNLVLTDNFNHLKEADIITNSGFLRPFNQKKIKKMKKGSIIPLLWESWEFREDEINLMACSKNEIAVLGTKERVKGHELMRHIKFAVLKLLLENQIETLNKKYLIFSCQPFKKYLLKLKPFFNEFICIDTTEKEDINRFKKQKKHILEGIDGIILCDHGSGKKILGKNGLLNENDIKLLRQNSLFSVFVICGVYDFDILQKHRITVFPNYQVNPKYMSIGLDYVSPEPIIDLNILSLKVAEIYTKHYNMCYNSSLAIQKTLKEYPFADELPKKIRQKFGYNL